jgi:hypothetical protein
VSPFATRRHFPKEGEPQSLFCDDCSAMLDLAYTDFDEDVSGVNVVVEGLPVLRCPACGRDHLPDRSRLAVLHLYKQAVESQKSRAHCTRQKPTKRFGFTDVPFLYDSDDFEYIPGLKRPWDEGFLTPVFFNRAVLLKYDNAPGYRVKFASTTYGDIITEEDAISFGINRYGKVVMWLGDIAKLPETEQYYLRSENVESDHSLGSEFYQGQIECIFTDPSREDALFGLRSGFIDACFLRFKTKLAHLDSEVINLALAFNPPVVDTPKERRHVADTLNKIHLESLDNGALEKAVEQNGAVSKGTGSLKRLQALLETIAGDHDISTILSPFYVLYDLRVAYSHLSSDAGAQAKLKTVTDRLRIAEGSDLLTIYSTLTGELASSYEMLIGIVET